LSVVDFKAKHPGLFLFVAGSNHGADPIDFETCYQSAPPTRLPPTPRAQPTEAQVLPIAKSPGNPYPDRISVGRARNCDIVIRNPSVSKLHAHLRVESDGSYTITDLGSHNGTQVDGRKLVAHTPEPLRPNSTVTLGAVQARVLFNADLHAVLRGRPS
jgi:hypothetical protein